MKARIIAVGNELLRGETIDTNSSFICSELNPLGIFVRGKETVPDDKTAIKRSLLNISNDETIIFITGGLGPTEDDITRLAVSEAFGLNLSINEKARKLIEDYFQKIGKEAGKSNLVQAMLPKGADVIVNERGTAPGFSLTDKGKTYYFLPGVPLEMEYMVKNKIIPALIEKFPDLRPLQKKTFKLFGIPESKVGDICSGMQKPQGVSLGFYPRFPEVHVSVFYKQETGEILNYIEKIRKELDPYIFAEDTEKLEEKLVDALIKNKLTLAVAESCTGGLISSTIVGVPGSSACFAGAIVSYSNELKVEMLSVPQEILLKHGAVSKECAIAMAKGARKAAKTSIGLSATGISGPGGQVEGKPLGTTFIAISTENMDKAWHFEFKRDRNQNRLLTVYEILTKLLKEIRGGNF